MRCGARPWGSRRQAFFSIIGCLIVAAKLAAALDPFVRVFTEDIGPDVQLTSVHGYDSNNSAGFMVFSQSSCVGSSCGIYAVKLKAWLGDLQWAAFANLTGGRQSVSTSAWPTADGGLVVTARSTGTTAWVFKLAVTGGVEWRLSYGGARIDGANGVTELANGDFFIAGVTTSFGR
jgi:hypothetical protein